MMICNSCKSSKFKILYRIKKFPVFWGAIPKKELKKIKSYPFELSFCKKCGLVQQSKRLAEKIINKVYTAEYYNCPSPVISGMGVSEIEKFIEFFKRCKNQPGKILEIACFDGYLLKRLKTYKWDVHGCDPCSSTNIAIKLLGNKRIKKVFFKKGVYQSESFDAVVFRNLLEHIYNPNIFLKEVSDSLKKGGKIFIDVPNLKEVIKLGGFGLFFHQHVTYFTINSIRILLERNGFKITNYYEGKPNLFVEATKTQEIKKIEYTNKDKKILNKLSRQSVFMKAKALSYFEDKKINNIVIFGSSALATTLIGTLNRKQLSKVKLVVDNDTEKHNKYLCGSNFKISPPKNILNISYDLIFITSHFFPDQITATLKSIGVDISKVRSI